MAELTISEETTVSGFWRHSGSSAELRVAALTSFRTSDGQLVPAGQITDRNSCCLITSCVVNEDLSVSIPEITGLPTTLDSIDNPNARYQAGLFAESTDEYELWPNHRLASGFKIETNLAPTTSWRLICL